MGSLCKVNHQKTAEVNITTFMVHLIVLIAIAVTDYRIRYVGCQKASIRWRIFVTTTFYKTLVKNGVTPFVLVADAAVRTQQLWNR